MNATTLYIGNGARIVQLEGDAQRSVARVMDELMRRVYPPRPVHEIVDAGAGLWQPSSPDDVDLFGFEVIEEDVATRSKA